MKDVVETAIECEHCGEYTMFGVIVPSAQRLAHLESFHRCEDHPDDAVCAVISRGPNRQDQHSANRSGDGG